MDLSTSFMRRFILVIFLMPCVETALASDSLYYIFTKVKIDGYVYNFLIDNGAEISLMAKNRINKDYSLRPVGKIFGTNHDTTTLFATTQKLTLNLVDIGIVYKMYIGVIDSLPNSLHKLGIDGVIGNDILSKHDWKIDFTAKKISTVNKKRLNKKEFRIIEFDERNYVPLNVEVSQGSIIRTKAEVDLGCHCYIDIWDSLHISSDGISKVSRRHSVSTFKEHNSHIEIAKISFDKFDIYGLPVDLKLQKVYNLIGVKFFAMYGEIYLVYSDRKIYLPKIKSKQVKINKLSIYNGVVESYIHIKGMAKPEWDLGQRVHDGFELRDEDYLYFDVFFEDK